MKRGKNVKTRRRKKTPKKNRLNFLRRISKVTGVLVAALFFLYFSAGFVLDKGFIKRDLGEKFGKVLGATTLTLRILGPPSQPVLSATPVCTNHVPYVNLFWTSDDQTDYFDLERDGDPLAAGLAENTYRDEAVQVLSSYSYSVTAFNSLGQNTSGPVSATVLECSEPSVPPEPPVSPDPTCVITKFQNKNLSVFHGTPSTEERRPRFYGTTNMPGAEIEIAVSGKTSIAATTLANTNGYWMWRAPDKLNFGLHAIGATAIDPNDSSRKKTASLNFKVEKAEEEESEKAAPEEKAEETLLPPSLSGAVPTISSPTQKIPLPEISVRVTNAEKVAYPGGDLSVKTEIKIGEGAEPFDTNLGYRIVDENRDEFFQASDRAYIDGDKTIEKNLNIPRLLKPGKYKVVVDISQNGTIVVAEDSFLLKETPLVNLGGGTTITATQIMSNLFWVVLWLLLLLVILLVLLSIEYRTSRHAIIQITEEKLRERGLITRKKIR